MATLMAGDALGKVNIMNMLAADAEMEAVLAQMSADTAESMLMEAREIAAVAAVTAMVNWTDMHWNKMAMDHKKLTELLATKAVEEVAELPAKGVVKRCIKYRKLSVAKKVATDAVVKVEQAERDARVATRLAKKSAKLAEEAANEVYKVDKMVTRRERMEADMWLKSRIMAENASRAGADAINATEIAIVAMENVIIAEIEAKQPFIMRELLAWLWVSWMKWW
jgi:hypothetical protein